MLGPALAGKSVSLSREYRRSFRNIFKLKEDGDGESKTSSHRRIHYVPYSVENVIKYKHHLYVCNRESNELQRHIMFRDILRKSPLLVCEYSNLKIQLSSEFRDNRKAYTEGKTEFVTRIMKEYKGVL
ncbi:GrpB family protein [Paenibacillus polysaccharolyticus]|uniref:GrpB family protein n=1 Tax=Paenibacillus polysaccharolyticus TaxID=582692 RepID=UPI00334035BE